MVVFFIEESSKIKMLKSIEICNDRVIIHKDINKIDKKMMNRINKILDNNTCKKVIVSKRLKDNKDFTNALYSNNINIANGKILLKKLIENIIDKICKENELKPKECQISFTINYLDRYIMQSIVNLSKEFKLLNIVSNNINSFKQLKEKIYNDEGIIITVTNNRRKALLKSDLIINYDFPEEIINKYIIKDDAIIINTEESINIHKKRFSGKILNNFDISLMQNSDIAIELEKEQYKKFYLKDLAEIYIMKYPEEINSIIV